MIFLRYIICLILIHSNSGLLWPQECDHCQDQSPREKHLSLIIESRCCQIDGQGKGSSEPNLKLYVPKIKLNNDGWISLGPEGGDIKSIIVHPSEPHVFYTYTWSPPVKLFKSTDEGESWELIYQFDAPVCSIVMDPTNPQIFYATGNNILYQSADGGETWSATQYSDDEITQAQIGVSRQNPDQLTIVGRINDYHQNDYRLNIYKSENNGESWSFETIMTRDRTIYLDLFNSDPSDDNVFYLAGRNSTGYDLAGFLLKSNDGGQHWNSIYSGLQDRIDALAIDPQNTDKIFAGTYRRVYRSNDGGSNWMSNSGYVNAHALALDPINSQVLYAGGYDMIYKSVDGGVRWTAYTQGFNGRSQCLGINPVSPNNILVGTRGGLFKSVTGGRTWALSQTGLIASHVSSIALAPSNPNILYLESMHNAIYKSTDCGDNLQRLPLFSGCGFMAAMAVSPASPDIVFAMEESG